MLHWFSWLFAKPTPEIKFRQSEEDTIGVDTLAEAFELAVRNIVLEIREQWGLEEEKPRPPIVERIIHMETSLKVLRLQFDAEQKASGQKESLALAMRNQRTMLDRWEAHAGEMRARNCELTNRIKELEQELEESGTPEEVAEIVHMASAIALLADVRAHIEEYPSDPLPLDLVDRIRALSREVSRELSPEV